MFFPLRKQMPKILKTKLIDDINEKLEIIQSLIDSISKDKNISKIPSIFKSLIDKQDFLLLVKDMINLNQEGTEINLSVSDLQKIYL